MFETANDVLTVKDICTLLPIGKSKAYKLIEQNEIKSVRVGKKIFVRKEDLIDFLTPS